MDTDGLMHTCIYAYMHEAGEMPNFFHLLFLFSLLFLRSKEVRWLIAISTLNQMEERYWILKTDKIINAMPSI